MGGRGSTSNRDSRGPEVPLTRQDEQLISMMSRALGLSERQEAQWRDNVVADQTARAEAQTPRWQMPTSVSDRSSAFDIRAYYSHHINRNLSNPREVDRLLAEAPAGTRFMLADGSFLRKTNGQETYSRTGVVEDRWFHSRRSGWASNDTSENSLGARNAVMRAGGMKEWNGRTYVTPGRG